MNDLKQLVANLQSMIREDDFIDELFTEIDLTHEETEEYK